MDIEKLKLHFIYVAGILVFLLILISTGLWTDKDNFTEYLTNAATAISIVLGLVAIFYSFISNSSMSQSLGNISKISDEVMQAKVEIENFLAHAVELENAGAENSRSLKEISTSVEDHVSSLTKVLASVADRTQILHDAVGNKIDQLEKHLIEANNDTHKAKNETESQEYLDARSRMVTNFVNTSSIIGRTLMYACVLANQSKKDLSLVKFHEITGFDESYIHGFFVALVATSYIEKKDAAVDDKVYEIIDVAAEIKSQIKEKVIKLITSTYINGVKNKNVTYGEALLKKIELLENSFQK